MDNYLIPISNIKEKYIFKNHKLTTIIYEKNSMEYRYLLAMLLGVKNHEWNGIQGENITSAGLSYSNEGF